VFCILGATAGSATTRGIPRRTPHPERVLLEQLGIAGHHLAMGIVDDLLAHPGLYVGVDHVLNADRAGAARIVVTPLPGQAGVMLDYEIFNPATPGRLLGHLERTIIGRSHQGPPVMVISDMHAASLTILRETGPGVFELGGEVAAYPMKVVISIPEPGSLHHSWWFGAPGEEAVERVVADLHLRH
jgi:hypothetical protein